MLVPIEKLTNKELIKIYTKGCEVVSGLMQVTGTKQAVNGSLFNQKRFEVNLRKLEQLEDEIHKRYERYKQSIRPTS